MKNIDYKILSENNRIKISIVVPLRGKIFDIRNRILADNKQIYRLIYDKEISNDHEYLVRKALSLIDITKENQKDILTKVIKTRTNQIVLLEDLEWLQVSRIEENIPDLPGIKIDIGYSRNYPTAERTSHILGYIGNISESDILPEKLKLNPEIKIGKSGIEKIKDQDLRGEPGIKRYEANAKGNIIRELSLEESIAGESIYLTIDDEIQTYGYEMLKNLESSAVLLNIKTGGVEALISTPGFDPNQFVNGVSSNYWAEILNDPSSPLTNKAISSYPPGSAFKLTVLLSALSKNIDPHRKVVCTGEYLMGNRIFHCSRKTGHGPVNMWEAIKYSCNCYTFEVARIIGIEAFAGTAIELGLGEKTKIELPLESAGNIPQRNWVIKMLKNSWQQGDTLNASIGQGYVLSSPLQLAILAARIASGRKVKPHIIQENNVDINDLNKFSKLNFSDEMLDIIRQGMFMVNNHPGGTSYNSRIVNTDILMAGKTSTAQVIAKRSDDDDLSKLSVEKKFRNHAIFIGYAPFDNPIYASCVFVEHGGSPRYAASTANKMMLKALQINGYNS